MPDDLRERLKSQYGEEAAAVRPSAQAGEGIWAKLQSLFAQPAFSGSLAALVLVGVLMSLLMRSNPVKPNESMRGTTEVPTQAATTILLYQLDDEQLAAIEESGYFESKLLQRVDDEEQLTELISQPGRSIIVDGAAGELRHEDGRVMALPENEAISDAITDLLSE